MTTNTLPVSKLTKSQKKTFAKNIRYCGENAEMLVTIRHDDECGNGHNTFAITGDIYKRGRRTDSAFLAGGCVHDEIAKHYPEIAHLIPWHLCSTDGPMHYLENSLYQASDKDHNGKRKGEPCRFDTRIKFDGFPITLGGHRSLSRAFIKWISAIQNFNVELVTVPHAREPETYKPKYTFGGFSDNVWHTCPFDSEREALEFLEALQTFKMRVLEIPTAYSEGKTPDLKAARNSAVWPDAELADFTTEKLTARLPSLMSDFKRVIESLGFVY